MKVPKVSDAIKDFVNSQSNSSNSSQVRNTARVVNMAMRAKKVFIATKSFVIGVLPVVVNPVFWVIVGVLVLVVNFSVVSVASYQMIGRNTNADGCYSIGSTTDSGGASVQDTGDWLGNAKELSKNFRTSSFGFLGNKPMSKEQTAAVIGNKAHESNLSPKIVEIGSGLNSGMSNKEMIALGDVYNKAIGLAQWDGPRRKALAEFAESKGKHWSDMGVQIDYFHMELETPYESGRLLALGFNDSSKSVEELTVIFQKAFERAGVTAYDSRISKAKEFLSKDDGSYNSSSSSASGNGGSGGASCLMAQDNTNGIGDSNVVDLAIKISYSEGISKARVPGGSDGYSYAKDEYKVQKDKVQKETSPDPMPRLFASCDRFVATVIRSTVDKDIPWGATADQYDYLNNSSKWERYTNIKDKKPGDIWITTVNGALGHIVVYIGEYEGKDSITQASYFQSVSHIAPSGMTDDFRDSLNRQYVGFRYVGGS